MKEPRKDSEKDKDVVLKYRPTTVDMETLRECSNIFEVSGDSPALVISEADNWLEDFAKGRNLWLKVGDAVISWGALTLVPYPDLCRGLVEHACAEHFESGDIFDRNAHADEKSAAICTWVRFAEAGTLTYETYLAEQKTEVKLVRDLYVRPCGLY